MEQDRKVDQQKSFQYYLKESIFWIYLSFMVLYGIIMISLLASGSTELSNLKETESFTLAQESINQWKKNYMIELTVQDNECPEGYENLIKHKWVGTQSGCGCDFTQSNITQTIVVKGECNSELLGFGCYNIQSQEPVIAQKWKNQKNLCVLRDTQYSMIDSVDEQCDLELEVRGYKKCGAGPRSVCRPLNSSCPISFIQNTEDVVLEEDGQELNFGEDVKYSYKTDQDGFFPIMDLRFDEFEHCLNPNQVNISPNKTGEYILMLERHENCKNEESRTNKIDDIGEEDFFRINERIWQVTMNDLPGYPRPSNSYSFKLSSQPYPYWSFQCRNHKDLNLKDAVTRFKLENESDADEHLVITTIISVVFVSFIFVIFEARKKVQRQKELIKLAQIQKAHPKYQQIRDFAPQVHKSWINRTMGIIILDKVFKLVNIYSIFVMYIELQEAEDWFQDVDKFQCGDLFYKEQIHNEYNQSIREIFNYLEAMMGLWWGIIFIDISFLIFRYLHEIKPTLDLMKNNKILGKGDEIDKLKEDDNDDKDNIVDEDDDEILDDHPGEKMYTTHMQQQDYSSNTGSENTKMLKTEQIKVENLDSSDPSQFNHKHNKKSVQEVTEPSQQNTNQKKNNMGMSQSKKQLRQNQQKQNVKQGGKKLL